MRQQFLAKTETINVKQNRQGIFILRKIKQKTAKNFIKNNGNT